MANSVATVAFIQGKVWAKSADGSMRLLAQGDVLNADEVVITAEGARVELDFGDGHAVALAGGQEVGLGPDLWEVSVTDRNEAEIVDETVEQVLALLEQDGDLLEELEETAAGGNDAGAGGGNSFVQVDRVSLDSPIDPSYAFGEVFRATGTGTLIADGVNQAPEAENLLISSPEDTPVSGRIIATDLENDTLTWTLQTGPQNGTLTLNPQTGEFIYTPNPDFNGPDSFVVVISDPRGNSTTARVDLDITPVNDAPTSQDLTLVTPEDTPISGRVDAQDPDGDPLTWVIQNPPTNGTVVIDPNTGEFVYTPNPDYNGGDSFVVIIDDGNGGTTTSTVVIEVTPVNDAPESNDQNLTTPQDTPIDGQIIATDRDGDELSYGVNNPPTNGTVTLNPVTGEFTYTPNPGYNGGDSFVVIISDGNGGTTTSTVTIGVTPVVEPPVVEPPVPVINTPPVTNNLNLSTKEDTPVGGRVIASDADGDRLTYTLNGGPSNGSLTSFNPNNGVFVYQPGPGYTGNDQFTVTVSDGRGGFAVSVVTIGVIPDTVTPPVNQNPVADDQSLTTDEDQPVDGTIAATDPDGDTLGYTLTGQPSNGTVTLNPTTGEFTYTPNPGYTGSDSFIVTVSDGKGGTDTATVTIGVIPEVVVPPVNQNPVADDQSLTTDEDQPVDGTIAATDPDGDTLGYTLTGQPSNGSVTLNPTTGEFTYTPNPGYTGSDSFIVTVSDGKGGTDTATVTIGVIPEVVVPPVNQNPVADDQSLTTDENQPVDGTIAATDPDGDTLGYALTGQPSNGSVTLNPTTGEFTYTPNPGYTGSDSFIVTVSDGKGGTDTATVTIGVIPEVVVPPVNQNPVADDQSLTTDEDQPVDGTIAATDPDGDTLGYTLTGQPSNGTVTLNPTTGEFTYTPNPGYTGSDSFIVTVSDGKGGTDTATVTIGVIPEVVVPPVNQNPVADDQSLTTDEDQPVDGTIAATDPDGDTLGYTLTGQPSNGSVTLNPTTGEFTYTPNPGYTGSDSFVVTVSDGKGGTDTATVTIGVIPEVVVPPVNQNPVANDQSLTTDENQPVDGTIAATDPDGDTLGYALTGQPSNGSVTLNPTTGEFTYTPNPGYTGSDSFIVTVSDGKGGTDTATVTIGVIPEVVVPPVNQNPVADDQSLTTDENQPVDGTIAATDPDGDTLGYALTGQPSNGSVTLNPTTGEFTYTPNPGYTGSDSFIVTVSDGKGGTDTATVNIGVIPVNEAPVAVDDPVGSPYTVALGTVATGTLSAPDSWNKATDSTGSAVKVTAYNANNTVGKLIFDGAKMGVDGTPRTVPTWAREEPKQIEYDITTGKSESVVIELNGNVTSATFGVANLIHNEKGGAEQGVWTAYYKGNLVASHSFHFVGKSAGDVVVNTGGKVFDSIRFSALDNLNNTGAGDGSGYYLTSFTASGSAAANSAYTVDPQGKLTVNSAKGLLVNDTDTDGDALVVSQVNGQAVNNGATVTLASGALLTINTDGSFNYDANGKFSNLAAGTLATDSFTYQISDGKGGYDEATATVSIIGTTPVPTGNSGGHGQNDSWGADTFEWKFGDQGTPGNPKEDVLNGFSLSEKDVLDLSDLLQGETTDTLVNYLHFEVKGANTEIHISSGGNYQNGFDANQTDQIIVLQNVNLNTQMPYKDLIQQLTSGGNLITD